MAELTWSKLVRTVSSVKVLEFPDLKLGGHVSINVNKSFNGA